MAVNRCFHKPEYIFYEVNRVSIRFPTKIEVLIDITPYGQLMEAYMCFHKLKYICYDANHIFHKLSNRFSPTFELLINTTVMWKDYVSVWLFHKLKYIYYEAVFQKLSIRSASKMDWEIDYDNHMGSLWKHMVVTITLNIFQMRLTMFPTSFP